MRRFVSPLLLTLTLASLSLGWRSATPPISDLLQYPINMTLADNVLYVSDATNGLHVFDVSDLTAPKKRLQIPLRGHRGAAVKGDIVYANEFGQLQAIQITGDSYTVVARIGEKYKPVDDGVFNEGSSSGFACACNTYSVDSAPRPAGGGSSSYATFALIGDYLYRVDEGDLVTYSVSTPAKPKEIARTHVGWEIETIYPTDNTLFIGGTRGMYIFDRSNPKAPVQLSQIEHARACDPVVVSGSTAYVTLRSNSGCGSAPDELLCVGIDEPGAPRIIGTKPLATPYGLAVNNVQLFVSHGDSGYSLLDVTEAASPSVIRTWTSPTRDFIWSGNVLFVMSGDNVAIFDVTDPRAPVFLSKVEPDAS